MNTKNCVTNKPIRCTTHFHACDCREYGFEMMKKENEEMRKDLLYFWTWIVGGYESRPETGLRNELDKMEEKYPWLRCETREPPMFNLSETPNSSKEGVK